MLRAILLAVFLLPIPPAFANQEANLQRDFSEQLTGITVENTDGPIAVQTWVHSGVRVLASRAGNDSASLGPSVAFERPVPDHLRIAVRRDTGSVPPSITLYVPASIHLAVRTGKGNVSVSGTVAGLSIITESGVITLRLPKDSNSDLSLQTIEGTIESNLTLETFGESSKHVLDGRVGQGGSTVIARSTRGNITILPEDDSSLASLRKQTNIKDVTDPGGSLPKASSLTLGTTSKGSLSTSSVDIPSGEDVLRLEARLVNLNVKVTDSGGKTLPALKKEDFVVYEDGILQDLSYFEPITAPLSIVLLLDLSGSTAHKVKIMKKAAQRFVDSLKPSDSIAVAAFTRRFFVISNFTTDHKQLKSRIGDIKNRHAGTAYYDAMWQTLDMLEEAKATRKAVVVLTDGVDNSLDHPDHRDLDPRHGFDDVLARVEEADATIYAIYLDTEYETIGMHGGGGHQAYVTARKQLEALTEQTGATMFKAERAEDLEGVYQQVAAELHSLYSMAYAPKSGHKDGKWRKISIAVDLPGAKVRTKRGYSAR
jgi:VWFA-related protein